MLENPSVRLRNSVISGKLSIVKRILSRFPDLLTEIDPANGWSLLHYASYHGKYLVCVHLLQLGLGRTEMLKTFESNTCVHLALLEGHEQTAHLLLQHFPQCLNIKGHRGLTPVQMTCMHDHHRCLSLLLGLGADLSIRDDESYTPLHTCLKHGSVNCMRMLILEGDLAAEECQTVGKWTPEDLCLSFQLVDIYRKALRDKRTHSRLPKRPSYQSMVSPLTIPKPVFENSGSPVLSTSPAALSFASQLPPLPVISTSRRTSVGSHHNMLSPKTPISHTFHSSSPTRRRLSNLSHVNTASSTSLSRREPSPSVSGSSRNVPNQANFEWYNKHSVSTMSMESHRNGPKSGTSTSKDLATPEDSRQFEKLASSKGDKAQPNKDVQLSVLNVPVSKIRK
ncbi:LAME_0E01024g1_1 [Lachancea meyersii CBS 8951]|uniref:LAME_0E01024g1_1 n=1 Tax=Lachancea meyersii CBS 8951 TaxID=1266667 RepID=A0A1G4JEU0_9SACH|nr:LAME_0E01024g1_1 [Lachancea meyersii CBS 8951]